MFNVGDKVKTDGNPHTSRATPDGNAPGIGTIPANSPGVVVAPGEVPDTSRPAPATQTNVKYDNAALAHGYMTSTNLVLVSPAPPEDDLEPRITELEAQVAELNSWRAEMKSIS